MTIELGLDTFGDVTVDDSGDTISYAQTIRNVLDQAVLADSVGVDFLGVGEHHRDDYAVSAPDVVLGAIAARTEVEAWVEVCTRSEESSWFHTACTPLPSMGMEAERSTKRSSVRVCGAAASAVSTSPTRSSTRSSKRPTA